ncbi:hypothetical protein STCU_07786 [Strigomonas culicis]|uniref:G domain-containing protein n=1 Tax=Strigomonas culicis TaxID=28005 RepID=S9U3A2_9TRYP|nr:hypothetical protein STCU_07786 [Strigomonas culicis]|eukprot:EPY23274.1 hypothetical protein STCU_07786 [Strigomonas culicis]
MPLVALAGRGVVGKTSLLRSLFRSPTEVSRSNRVLRRDAMNYFNVGDVFNIVDLPGFGGTSLPWSTLLQHAVLVRNFARVQPSLKMIYYCMDVHYKHGVYVQDIDMLRFLSQEVPNFTIVITKAEQINEQSRSQNFFRMEDIRKELMFNDIQHPVLITSAYRMGGIDTLRFDMVMNALHALPTEHLTYTEAKRLSQRLFSQAELGTVRPLLIPPTQLDDEVAAWNREVREAYREFEEAEEPASSEALATGPGESQGNGAASTSAADEETKKGETSSVVGAKEEEFAVDAASVAEEAEALNRALTVVDPEMETALKTFGNNVELQEAYRQVVKTTRNKGLMQYVKETSPWRNPPSLALQCGADQTSQGEHHALPGGPEQPVLDTGPLCRPRADFYFRRPNVGFGAPRTRAATRRTRCSPCS